MTDTDPYEFADIKTRLKAYAESRPQVDTVMLIVVERDQAADRGDGEAYAADFLLKGSDHAIASAIQQVIRRRPDVMAAMLSQLFEVMQTINKTRAN